jgi:Xaa-Pro aminopeptidase
MDKKMRRVSKKIRKAESTLKKAEKENMELADYDERVRDPMIKKCKHDMKKKRVR